MFWRQSKKHFSVANSSFADMFEENYFNFSIVFAPSKKSEFQRLMKEIYRPILKIYVFQCGLTVDM